MSFTGGRSEGFSLKALAISRFGQLFTRRAFSWPSPLASRRLAEELASFLDCIYKNGQSFAGSAVIALGAHTPR